MRIKKNDKIRFKGRFYKIFSVTSEYVCLESLEKSKNKHIVVKKSELQFLENVKENKIR